MNKSSSFYFFEFSVISSRQVKKLYILSKRASGLILDI